MPSVFMDSIASGNPMFPGSAVLSGSPDLNFSFLPGMQGPQGMAAHMFLTPLMQQMLGPGFMAAPFQPTHNLYDHYRQRARMAAYQSVLASSAQTDQQLYANMLRGMAATAGVPWTTDRERAAQIMAQDMTRISPLLAQVMPQTFDQLHGARGSASIMAQGLFAGGRYRTDPVTGLLRMSSQSITEMNRQLYERLYGPGADLSLMRGVGAGTTGQMFDEMARRGLLPQTLSRPEAIRAMAEQDLRSRGTGEAQIRGQLGTVMQELQNLASPQLEQRLRQFDADRVARRLRDMSGAVTAMREVFGEHGRPDAPMSQLIEGLQVMTQGGLHTMSPGRVEQTVRQVNNMARQSGMGLDNMMVLMATGAQRADQMGLDRTLGVTASLQAAAFSSAYANQVGGPAWGRGDRERLMALDQQLRLNAAASPVANQLAATLRLADQGFRPGSEASAMAQAIQAGQQTYEYGGQTRSVYADPGRWQAIMTASGVSASTANAYRGQTAYNQRFVDEHDLTGLSRRLQGEVDIAPRLGAAYERAARQAGITDRNMARRLGQAAAQGLLRDLNPDQFQNPEAVASYLADRVGIDRADAARMTQLRSIASLGYGNFEQLIRTNPGLRGYRTADQAIQLQRQGTLQAADSHLVQEGQERRLQTALAGIGASTPLRRLVDSFLTATPGTSFRDIAAQVLGWVPQGQAAQALEGTVQSMQREIQAYRNAPDGAAGAQIRSQALERIRGFSSQLQQASDTAGLPRGAPATSEDAARIFSMARNQASAFTAQSGGLADRILHDDRSMTALGAGGLGLVQRLRQRSAALRTMADANAGGNVGLLLSSEDQRTRARTVSDASRQLSGQIDLLTRQILEAEGSGNWETANNLRSQRRELESQLQLRQRELQAVGSETGVSPEVLAAFTSANPEAFASARTQAEEMRRGQLTDLQELQQRLRDGGTTPLTQAQQQQLRAARRTATPPPAGPAPPTLPSPVGGRPAPPEAAAPGSAQGGELRIVIEGGTLTIPGLGEGRLVAQGRGGPRP